MPESLNWRETNIGQNLVALDMYLKTIFLQIGNHVFHVFFKRSRLIATLQRTIERSLKRTTRQLCSYHRFAILKSVSKSAD